MAKRATKEQRVFYGKMAADAREICWKLQNNVPLTAIDRSLLDAMPQDVQTAIQQVGDAGSKTMRDDA